MKRYAHYIDHDLEEWWIEVFFLELEMYMEKVAAFHALYGE